MTNLDLHASPIIRFDSGDLVDVKMIDGVPHITTISGRQIDTIVAVDGREVSPYRVTDALGRIHKLRQFKIVQDESGDLLVNAEVDKGAEKDLDLQIGGTLRQLLGSDIGISIQFHRQMVAEGSIKFRPIESRVPRS